MHARGGMHPSVPMLGSLHLLRDILNIGKRPHTVSQHELPAVSLPNEIRMLLHNAVRNQCSAHHTKVFIEEHSRQDIEVHVF
jgi:hypothetical protein